MRTLGSLVRGLFTLASVLAAICGLLRLFYVDVVVVPHNGMAPTLTYGDRVLVWRRAKVDLGEVVVCEHPARPEASVIGRAVAFAGHRIEGDARGNVYVDGDRAGIEWGGNTRFYDVTREKLFEMGTGNMEYGRQHRHEFFLERGSTFWLRPFQVNHGVYLLGDNRSDAIDDSREFGEVDPEKCLGQVFMRLAPAPPQEDDIRHSYLDLIW